MHGHVDCIFSLLLRIIGKYGGSPALGAMVMPRLMKESILKATGSPGQRNDMTKGLACIDLDRIAAELT